MITVDTQVLARVIGLAEWPADQPLSERQQMAARVITDFVGHDHLKQPAPDVAIRNAVSWINRAYDAGQAAGIALERKAWHAKLAALFDIPVAR